MKTPNDSNQLLIKSINDLHNSFVSSDAACDLLMEILTAAMGSDWAKIAGKNDPSNATALCWRLSNLIRATQSVPRSARAKAFNDKSNSCNSSR